jgi:hypothetical protein
METIKSYTKEAAKYQKKIVFNAGIEAAKEYFDQQSAYSHKIQLLFAPYGLPWVPLEIVGTDAGKIISSFHWTKDRSNPGGMLSIEIQPDSSAIDDMVKILNKYSGNLYSKIWGALGVDLEDLFKPMTLCQLWIDGYHVMTGTIRSCHRSMRIGNKDFSNSYTISIDELGNVYTRNTLRLDTIVLEGQLLTLSDDVSKSMNLVSQIKNIPLQAGIQTLAYAFLTSVMVEQGMQFSDGLPLSVRMMATPNPIGGIANFAWAMNVFCNVQMFQIAGQSFWDFMKNFIPSPWMEFYTESGGRTIVTEPLGMPAVLMPGFNYIVSRSVPYSNPLIGIVNPSYWLSTVPYDLSLISMLAGGDFIIVTDDDISDKNLGFDCSNQATSFRATYGGGAGSLTVNEQDRPVKTCGPLNPFASGGVPTFGKIEMTQAINCIQLCDFDSALQWLAKSASNGMGIPGIVSKPALSNLLAVWFRNQSRFREGEITTRLMPYARAGMYLLYLPTMSNKKIENIRDIGVYYIDSVNHSMNVGDKDNTARTTFNVIRGVPLPATQAQSALLLFDFEILPPISGLWDGEYAILSGIRRALLRVG